MSLCSLPLISRRRTCLTHLAWLWRPHRGCADDTLQAVDVDNLRTIIKCGSREHVDDRDMSLETVLCCGDALPHRRAPA